MVSPVSDKVVMLTVAAFTRGIIGESVGGESGGQHTAGSAASSLHCYISAGS